MKKIKINKKGIEMAVNTLILITLGILILIGLIMMFSGQMGKLMNYIKGSEKSNVDSVVSLCNNFALQEQEYSYCCEKRKIIFQDKEEDLSCSEIKGNYSYLKIDGFACREC